MAATQQTTTLHFPGNESWGLVLLCDEEDRWRPFAPAKGDVEIPAGVACGLQIAPKLPGDHFPPKPFDGSKIEMLSLVGTTVTDHELENLARFPNLRRLALDGPTITDLGAEAIASCKNLEFLLLWRTGITAYGFEKMLGLRYLRELMLSGDGIDNEAAQVIGQIGTLESLDLFGCRIDDQGIQQLAGLHRLKSCTLPSLITASGFQTAVNWSELEKLNAHKSQINAEATPTLEGLRKLQRFSAPADFGNEGLPALAQFSELHSLSLVSTEINALGLRHLASLPNLTDVSLRSPVLWAESELLARFPSLRWLHLSDRTIRVLNLTPLSASKSLKTLSVSPVDLSRESFETIAILRNLENLDILQSLLSPWEFLDLQDWLPTTKITHQPRSMSLSPGRLTGELLSRTFAKDSVKPWQPHPARRSTMAGFPERVVYTFPVDCEISYRCRNTEPREIEDLLQKQGLEILELVFKECYISREVAGFLPYFGRVKTLDLSHCEIDMRFFHTVYLMASLSRLVLEYSNLGDAQAELLSKADQVETLLLRATMLGDMGLSHIESMKGLKTLDVAGTRVTREGIEKFRTARPDVELVV